MAGIDIPRMFLETLPEPLRDRPMPRRRFALTLLFPCAVTAIGGLLFITHQWLAHDDRRARSRTAARPKKHS